MKKSYKLIIMSLMLIFISALLNACREATFTFNFDSNGGTEIASITTDGKSIIAIPTEPTREGYAFGGWFLDKDVWEQPVTASLLLDAPIQSDMTAYAQWLELFTITYDSNGGSEITANTEGFTMQITAPANPTKTGYTFAGWYTEPEFINYYIFSTMPAENITLYAEWGTQGLEYKLINGNTEYSVSQGTATSELDIFIPKIHNGKLITSIEVYAFSECTLTSITIPNSITSIEAYAFRECTNLTNIIIPNTVTSIGAFAFLGCTSLQYEIIDASLKYLGNWLIDTVNDTLTTAILKSTTKGVCSFAFYNCTSLTSVTIPDSVTSICVNAFYNCPILQYEIINTNLKYLGNWLIDTVNNTLTTANLKNTTIGIGSYAFSNCLSLTSITIPDSLISICDHAFYGCTKFASITIPDSVISIGDGAFSLCYSLTDIMVDSLNITYKSIDGVLYNKTGTTLICYPIGKTETTYTIPNSVTTIATNAFRLCDGLTDITVDSINITFKSIDGVLYNKAGTVLIKYPVAKEETTYIIPSNVTSIGNEAFYYCTSLTSIIIPNSVTSIGENAFYNCINLTSIIIPNNVTSIGDYSFNNCASLVDITIPDGVTNIGYCAFSDCTSLTSIIIPDSVISIGEEAFYGCTSLTNISIPDSVISIDDWAFSYCTSLTTVNIERSSNTGITTGSSKMFDNCASILKIYVPDEASVTAYKAANGWSKYADMIYIKP